MPKNIQISQDLFLTLCRYHLMECTDVSDDIKNALNDKLDALVQRDLYTQYKTAASEEQRNQARQKYLDKRNIPDNFRW